MLVARLLHSLQTDKPSVQFQVLCTAKQHLVRGGPRRLRHTLPALGFCALKVRGGGCGKESTMAALHQKEVPSTSVHTALGGKLCLTPLNPAGTSLSRHPAPRSWSGGSRCAPLLQKRASPLARTLRLKPPQVRCMR